MSSSSIYNTCNGCTYTLEKELGFALEGEPYGLIPYVNLSGPYFNITPKLYGAGEVNITYGLGLPPGPSVQLYSPQWVESDDLYILPITIKKGSKTLVRQFKFATKQYYITGEQCGPRLVFKFSAPIYYVRLDVIILRLVGRKDSCHAYFDQATLLKLGTDCKLEPVGPNRIDVYPGNNTSLVELDYVEFIHPLFPSQKVYLYYEPISAILKPINQRLIYTNTESQGWLEVNISSNFSDYCGYTPTLTYEVSKPNSCDKEPTIAKNRDKFTITNICANIAVTEPYNMNIQITIGPNTFHDQIYFYSQSNQSIDHKSPITKQKTGSMTILFSEQFSHPNQTTDYWKCNDFFFLPQTTITLGPSCIIQKIGPSNRIIEIIFGKETTLVSQNILRFSESFCKNCKIQIIKNTTDLSFTTSNNTEIWKNDIVYTVTLNVASINFGEAPTYFYWFYEPPMCSEWGKSNAGILDNIITLSNLCESSFPHKLKISATYGQFYREKIVTFVTKANEQLSGALYYQWAGMIWAIFNGNITYPTASGTTDEWNCSSWFIESSSQALGSDCKVHRFPQNPEMKGEIRIQPGYNSIISKNMELYFKSSICGEDCSLLLTQEQPSWDIQLRGLPEAKSYELPQLAAIAKDYCTMTRPTQLYGVDQDLEFCLGVTYTYEIVPLSGQTAPQIAVMEDGKGVLKLNFTDLEQSDYFYKFIIRMTLSTGFYRERELKFYTQPIQEILGVLHYESSKFEVEFSHEFDNLPVNTLSEVFDASTVTAIGSGSVISSTGNTGFETVLNITLGADSTLVIGDELKFNDNFCSGCIYILTEVPVFNCTGLDYKKLNIKTAHAITCSIQNLNMGESREFKFTDISQSSACPLHLELTGTFNEIVAIKVNTLCNNTYKMKIEFISDSFKKIINYTFTTFDAQLDSNFHYSVSFTEDITFPDPTGACDIYWFKPETTQLLGSDCEIEKLSPKSIKIKSGQIASRSDGDKIIFSDTFCEDCNIIISFPSFTLTHDDLPYWNPELNHTITATVIDNIQGGTPVFVYNVITKPTGCSKDIGTLQGNQVTILDAKLCTSLESYKLKVWMKFGDIYEKHTEIQFVTQLRKSI